MRKSFEVIIVFHMFISSRLSKQFTRWPSFWNVIFENIIHREWMRVFERRQTYKLPFLVERTWFVSRVLGSMDACVTYSSLDASQWGYPLRREERCEAWDKKRCTIIVTRLIFLLPLLTVRLSRLLSLWHMIQQKTCCLTKVRHPVCYTSQPWIRLQTGLRDPHLHS